MADVMSRGKTVWAVALAVVGASPWCGGGAGDRDAGQSDVLKDVGPEVPREVLADGGAELAGEIAEAVTEAAPELDPGGHGELETEAGADAAGEETAGDAAGEETAGDAADAADAAADSFTCPGGEVIEVAEFMYGVNIHGTRTGDLEVIKALGAAWHAPFLLWRDVEPSIAQPGLTVEQVQADPGLVAAYVEEHDWAKFDEVVDTLLAQGFQLFPVIGQAMTGSAPDYEGKPIIPHEPEEPIEWYDNPAGLALSPIGRDNYRGHLYLHLRATVQRYKEKVHYWMVDPEMNQSALFRVFGTWKAGNAWADWDFLTQHLLTMVAAVKEEDPDAVVCLPFNVDHSEAVTLYYAGNELLSGAAVTVLPWPEAIAEWAPHVDMVGVDFFESQGTTDGDSYARLRERIETAVERGCGKPVIVASIGAPSGPAELGWTEPYQAQYLAGAFDAAVDAGAVGFFYFEPKTGDSHGVEITEFDLTVMDKAREVLNGGWTQTVEEFQVSVEGFILWALEQFGDDFDAGVEYFTGHFFQVLETAEAYWGLVHGDGSPKPGFSCLSCRYHGQDCAAAGCAY